MLLLYISFRYGGIRSAVNESVGGQTHSANRHVYINKVSPHTH